MKSRKSLPTRSLRFESLERREVMTGNVIAQLDVNNNLVLTGTPQGTDNFVAVYPGSFGKILVAGGRSSSATNSGTLVNGFTTPVSFDSIAGIIVNMGDGNDRVMITKLTVPGDISGTLGPGDDQFALQSNALGAVGFVLNDGSALSYGKVTVSGSASIDGGTGDDTFSMYDATVGVNVTYFGGNNDDTFVQSGTSPTANAVGGSVLITPSSGDDTTTVFRMAVGQDFTVNDGSAVLGSTVSLTNLRTSRDITLNLSIRRDVVALVGENNTTSRFQSRNVTINTGDGNDDVTVNQGIMTNLSVNTGNGNEGGGFYGIELTNLAINTQLFVNTGAGFDNTFLQNINVKNLGVFNPDQSDGVIAQTITATNFVFTMSDSNDVVGVYGSTIANLAVYLLGGNDQLYVGTTKTTASTFFDGGTGFNTFNDVGGNTFVNLTRTNI